MEYKSRLTLASLQDESVYLVQNDQELAELLDSIGISEDYKTDITGACIIFGDGEYLAIWLTESAIWYDLSSTYYSLPFYLSTYQKINYEFLPEYWKESNPFYHMNQPTLKES